MDKIEKKKSLIFFHNKIKLAAVVFSLFLSFSPPLSPCLSSSEELHFASLSQSNERTQKNTTTMRSTLASSSMASTSLATRPTTTAARFFRPVVAAVSRAPCAPPAAARVAFSSTPLTGVGGKSNSRLRFSRSSNVSASATSTVAPPGKTPPMPFVRLAGQEEMKLALLLNVIDPGIGGVLIMGDRGPGRGPCFAHIRFHHFAEPGESRAD